MIRQCFFRRIAVIVLLLVAFIFSSCTHCRTSAVLDDVETFIKDRPDSALAVIRSIDTATLTTRSLRAHYSLLHAIALDKNWIDTTDEKIVMPAVQYYDCHQSDIRRAKAWYYLGRIQQNQGDIIDASMSFFKAEKYSEHFDDNSFKALVCFAISTINNKNFLNEEALNYAERAYSYSVAANDTANANSALYCMAMYLNNVGRYHESDSLYRVLINSGSLHSNLRSSLLSNFALNLANHNNAFDEAVALFEEAISTYGPLKQQNFWGAYAYALARTGNKDKADAIFNKLEKGTSASAIFVYSNWKSNAEAFWGNDKSAYHLLKAASDIQLENVKKVLKQSSIKAQKNLLEKEVIESGRMARRRQLIAWGTAAALLVLIVTLVLLFRRRSKRADQDYELSLSAYRELTRQFDYTEQEKARVREKYIYLCQSHFSHIGRINEMLKTHSKEDDTILYHDLKHSFHQINEDEEYQTEFEKILDGSFNGVMTLFRTDFPGRKEKFYKFVSYLFAGFETTTICAIIPEYNKHNVYVEKSRLKHMIKNSDSLYKDQFLSLLS